MIPILAILPFLAASNGAVLTPSAHNTDFAPWQRALLVFGIRVAIVAGGRFLIRPVFRYLAGMVFESATGVRKADEIDEQGNPVILAGFGRFGHIVGRILHLRGINATVLDLDAEQVELVRWI